MEAKTDLQARLTDERTSAARKYQELVVGKSGKLALLKYELIMLLCNATPGALGFALRKFLYKRLFRHVGRGVVFGRNLVIRHPARISLGSNVILDDNCVLDAKGEGEEGITIADNVFVGRNTILSCKGGSISLGENANLGSNCLIHAESPVRVGKHVLIASYCYLVGGGNHDFSRTDIPIIQQPSVTKGGISIGDGAWLGARATILDGANVGHDSIVGAGAVVLESLPESVIAAGVPARTIKQRKQPEGSGQQSTGEQRSEERGSSRG